MHTLTIALAAVLLIDPIVVLSPGFWLSFTAVGLIFFTLGGRLRRPGWLMSGFRINWAAALGLSPIILCFFQQVSLIAPLANLIAVPVIGLIIVPFCLVATLVMLALPKLGVYLFVPVDFALQALWRFLLELSGLPVAVYTQVQPNGWVLAFAISGVLLLLTPKGMPSRWLGVVLVLPMLISESLAIKSGEVKVTLLDVGQGLSAVVQTAKHVLVYDTGAKFSETSDAGQSIVIPFLRSQGISALDALVVSHGDNDHIGGAASLLKSYPPTQLLTSVPQMLAGYQPKTCQAGQSWRWDEVDFAILSPNQGEFLSDNDNSCVLRIQGAEASVLLTGDIEAEAESRLAQSYGAPLTTDILLPPHHGSSTSSTREFIRTVNPKLILIPAGYRNQFGHPHPKVLRQYDVLGKTWLVNAEEGAISLRLTKPLPVESWRKVQGRYWNYLKR